MLNVARSSPLMARGHRKNRLRVDARRQGEELTNEAKKRIADVERRFMRSKDKTIAKLAKVKEQIEQIAGGLAVVQQEAVTLLAQRGMTLNVDTASRSFTDGPPAKAADAIERCHARIQHARELLHWMAPTIASLAVLNRSASGCCAWPAAQPSPGSVAGQMLCRG